MNCLGVDMDILTFMLTTWLLLTFTLAGLAVYYRHQYVELKKWVERNKIDFTIPKIGAKR